MDPGRDRGTSLKQDISELDVPGVLVAEVESSRVEQCLPPEVRYVSLLGRASSEERCSASRQRPSPSVSTDAFPSLA